MRLHHANKALDTYPYQCCKKFNIRRNKIAQTTDQVNVIEVALSCTSADHFRNPAKALSSGCAGSNSRESLLDRLKSKADISKV
jgi:hypothetical protein